MALSILFISDFLSPLFFKPVWKLILKSRNVQSIPKKRLKKRGRILRDVYGKKQVLIFYDAVHHCFLFGECVLLADFSLLKKLSSKVTNKRKLVC